MKTISVVVVSRVFLFPGHNNEGPKKLQKCATIGIKKKLKKNNRFSLQRDIHCIGNVQFLSKENVCTCHLQTFPLIQWTLVIGKAGQDKRAG